MRSALFAMFASLLLSCGETAKAPKEIQHDTLRTVGHKEIAPAKDTIANGEYMLHYENGVIKIRGMMKDGQREGLWKSWYDNGSPWSETSFKAGKKDGPTTTWYENEKKRYTGFYTNDEESGKWTFWDESGKVVSTKDYDQK